MRFEERLGCLPTFVRNYFTKNWFDYTISWGTRPRAAAHGEPDRGQGDIGYSERCVGRVETNEGI